jgi:hypothetical protein
VAALRSATSATLNRYVQAMGARSSRETKEGVFNSAIGHENLRCVEKRGPVPRRLP